MSVHLELTQYNLEHIPKDSKQQKRKPTGYQKNWIVINFDSAIENIYTFKVLNHQIDLKNNTLSNRNFLNFN